MAWFWRGLANFLWDFVPCWDAGLGSSASDSMERVRMLDPVLVRLDLPCTCSNSPPHPCVSQQTQEDQHIQTRCDFHPQAYFWHFRTFMSLVDSIGTKWSRLRTSCRR